MNKYVLRTVLVAGLCLLATSGAEAQFLKKLGKKAQEAAERTVERRVEQESSKKTDQALDSILEPGSKSPENPVPRDTPNGNGGGNGAGTGQSPESSGGNTNGTIGSPATGPKSLEIYSKFDFVPGDELLFYDDFGDDFIGDFPAKWNTNGSGEVVTLGNSPQRWLKTVHGYSIYYIPDVPDLPEDYTIEFDIAVNGVDRQTSSTASITVHLSETKTFDMDGHWARVSIPVGQYTVFSMALRNFTPRDGSSINSDVKADIRQAILDGAHISIAVNGSRYRLWVNETKFVDVPRFIPENSDFKAVKINTNGLREGVENILISNFKVAKGGVDLRRKLLSEGKISTNAILFDSGSANLQPASMGVIRQISQVLQQDSGIRLQIVGHTDSDGEAAANQALSEARAAAVRDALVSIYNVSGDRLEVAGKGESEPVAENAGPNGKAQNRRVEFIKL